MPHKLLSASHFNFTELAPGVGFGEAPDVAWYALPYVPLIVFVGVTGVGKSTTLQALREQQFNFALLPDRRELTDHLIIAFLQRQAGVAPHPVTDRTERFQLTRRYREQFSGGNEPRAESVVGTNRNTTRHRFNAGALLAQSTTVVDL